MEDKKILCGANSYHQRFYLNPFYDNLPQTIKDELKIMCVLFVQEVGGILILEFSEEGSLRLVVTRNDDDIYYDEINSELNVRRLRKEKEELFSQLEEYYNAVSN